MYCYQWWLCIIQLKIQTKIAKERNTLFYFYKNSFLQQLSLIDHFILQVGLTKLNIVSILFFDFVYLSFSDDLGNSVDIGTLIRSYFTDSAILLTL